MSAASWDPVADLAPVEMDVASGVKATVFLCRFPGCGRQFQLKGNLKRHQNIHNGDKQFRCDFCGRSFLRKADMEVHLRVHTGEKPYECKHSGCGKRFARRSDLLSHERTHSGSKPFACEFPGCGRRFARRFDLHKHERSHDGDGARATDKKATMKRRLVVSCHAESQSMNEQDDSALDERDGVKAEKKPSPYPLSPQRSITAGYLATGDASVTTPASRAAPISPTDHADGPGKEFHFELTCTEDHVHTTPDCFSMEEWDALLGASTQPGTACCPEHLHSVAETFTTAPTTSFTNQLKEAAKLSPSFESKAAVATNHFYAHTRTHGLDEPNGHTNIDSKSRSPGQVASVSTPSNGVPPLSLSPTHAIVAQLSATSLNSPCPIVATAKLHDYAAHISCGHLAIQHGNHRDFVVKNHLVCLDNVKSLSGDCSGGVGTCAKPKQPISPNGTKCAPHDPHRPGCGHLAVRHRDHIDYVVEDNLFCQLAGGLMEDAENIELLDDDFWEFYGAIGSLKTD